MRNSMRTYLVTLAAAGVLAGCSDKAVTDLGATLDGPPVPGTLTVSLVTPNPDDGGVAIRVTGVDTAEPMAANPDHHFYFVRDADEILSVAVLAERVGGPVMTIAVPDIRDLSLYQFDIIEVVSRSNLLRTSLTDYRLRVATDTERDASEGGTIAVP